MAGEVAPEVLARAQAGDAAAFAELIRHYDHRLRALAYRLLGNRDLMDDALQEAYVKAYRALSTFRTGAAPGTWLYRITWNACLDELRRQKRRPVEPFDADGLERVGADTAPAADAGAAGNAALERALAALPPDQRAALWLVDGEAYDYATAGEILGVPAGTVGSRVSRARAAVRSMMTKSGPDDTMERR